MKLFQFGPSSPGFALLVGLALGVGSVSPASAEPQDEKPSADAVAEGGETDAAEEPAPERLFEQLLVVGSPEGARAVPGSAHFVTRADLERQEYGDVHRILRQVPGINIQEEDGYGLRPNIGIRGTGVERSQKITLLEDGILIAPAPYSAPSAYYTPTAGRMESFEVRKGSGAIRQGPYTNGGAVNFVSTSIPGAFSGRLALAAGDEDLRRARGWVGDSGETFGWLLETYQLRTDGFKNLDGGGSTGVDLADYLAKLRFNSRPGADLYQAFEIKLGKTEQDGEETYLGLTRTDFDRDPYRRYAASAGDNLTTDHEQVQLSYLVRPRRGFDLTATIYRNDFFRNWFKLEKVNGIGVSSVLARPEAFADELAVLRAQTDSAPAALAVRNNRRDYYSQGVQAVLAWDLGGSEDTLLEVGVRYHEDEEDRFQEEDLFQMTDGRRTLTRPGAPGSQANRVASAEALAVFAQTTLTSGRWTFTPGVRVERIDLGRRDFGGSDPQRTGAELSLRENELTEVIPGFGASYRPDSSSIFFAGVHRGFSPPSPSSTREVEAEESLNYELGWRHRSAGVAAEVVGFWNDYDNLLGNDTVSGGGGGTGEQFNGGEVVVGGLEAGLSLDLAAMAPTASTAPSSRSRLRLPFRLTYTFTTSEFRKSFATSFADWAPAVERGDELPYLPRHQIHAGLGIELDRWGLELDAGYTDEMRTRAGSGSIPIDESIEDRLLVDLRTDYRLREGLSVWAQLLNATDEVYVAARRPAGLRPGRPRAVLVGVSLDFNR